MDELKLEKKSTSFLNVLLYILSVIFPALGFTLGIQKDREDNPWKKVALKIAIISGIIWLATIIGLSISVAINHDLVLGTFRIRTLLLILYAYVLINTATYAWFIFFYFDKEENNDFKTKLYRTLKAIFVTLIPMSGIACLYTLDEVVTSFPRGIPWDSFSWEGGQSFTIAFYAICILIGACITWFIAVNKAHAAGYKRDIFDPIMYVAFPMGIVGARVWYCISCWDEFSYDPISVFDLRSGGLAIQGGVILGAFFGMWIMCEFHREMKLRDAMDMIIPGILIAQAMGRWGNFFNNEVFGAVADPNEWWFIPRVIITHMQAYKGDFYVPLFLIESTLNICGYFIITKLIGKLLHKWLVRGDQAFLYFVWYGTVRCVMEPLRNASFIMGTSVQMSVAFIVVGAICIVLNHVYNWYVSTEKFLENQAKRYEKYHELATKFESMPKWARILLALPIVDGFAYAYYRFIKGHYYSALLWFIFGGTVCWLIDIISIAFLNRPLCAKAYV